MKLNKKQVGLIAGVVCVILLTILLLSMCNGSSQEEPAVSVTTEASEATVPATGASVETTEASTGETEEATEETTEPTTGGSSKPGGTGGSGIGGGTGDNVTEPAMPKAGSEESPYMEVVPQFPDRVETVSIPADGTVHYYLSLQDESVDRYGESLLVIEGENVSVLYNEKTYEAINGVVTIPLVQPVHKEEQEDLETVAPAAEEESDAKTEEQTNPEETAEEPISIKIRNIGAEARSLTMTLDAPLGTRENPEEIRGEDGSVDFTAELEANDEEGYYFGFEAERDGTMVLQLDKVTVDGAIDVVVTAGETAVTIPSDGSEKSVQLEFKKGDRVFIHVQARASEDGSRPAAALELIGSADYYGSKNNPIEVEKDFTTEEMAPGQVLYYLVKNQKSKALNVEYPAYVIYNEKTYQEKLPEGEETTDTEVEIPVVSVKIGNGDTPVLMAIGNGGEETASFDVTFTDPIGHVNNMAELIVRDEETGIDGINTAVVEAGDQEVYWFTWKNTMDTGILTLKMPENGNWKYTVTHISGTNSTAYDAVYSDSEPAIPVFSIVLKYDDTVNIQVSTYDPADQATLPAGSVSVEATFQPHALIGSEGETYLTIDGETLIYCKQGLKKADGAIMTVVAVEADEEGNAKLDENGNLIVLADSAYTIDYEGVIYTSANGKIVVENIVCDSNNPDIFSFRNDGKDKTLYCITFSYPLGHQTNPVTITNGSYAIELYGDGGSGYYYRWITSEPCIMTFEVDPSTIVSYNISSTKDTTVTSSTNNGTATDFKHYVELVISQGHLNESKDGTVAVTINLGNPSTDSSNKIVVPFRVESYQTKVTADTTAKVAAGKSHRLMQMLNDTSAAGMTISGAEGFTVVYGGKEYLSDNGRVEISNLATGRTYFQIINRSGAEQEYEIDIIYPVTVSDSRTVTMKADEKGYFVQMLADPAASGMTVTGSDAFKIIYAGVTYEAVSGTVTIENFTSGNTNFQILNGSVAQTVTITYQYPVGSIRNPDILETGKLVSVSLKDFTLDSSYCYVWTAEEDGVFQFDLVGNIYTLCWRPWKYELIHGETVYASEGAQFDAVITQSFPVSKGDRVIIKLGVVALDQTTVVPVRVSFTKTVSAGYDLKMVMEEPSSHISDEETAATEPVAE